MKKQLLIAAVAATMSSVSMADISLSGAGNMKVKSNGTSSIDMDLTLTAKSGDTTAVAKFKNLQGKTVTADDVHVATTIEGLTVKAGVVKTQGGNGTLYKTAAKDLVVSTSIGGFGVAATVANDGVANKNAELHISGSVAGFDVKVQNATNTTARLITIGGSVAGLNIDVESSDAADSYTVGGSFSGVDAHYTNATSVASNATQDDGADFNMVGNSKATALVATMNGVTVKQIKTTAASVVTTTNKISMTRGNVKYTASKVKGSDAVLEAKVAFKF